MEDGGILVYGAVLFGHKDCSMLAAELMSLRINWDETDPEKVVQETPDQARLQEIFRLYGL